MARQVTEAQAVAFARLLAEEMGDRSGGVMVIDLANAAEMLWSTNATIFGEGAVRRSALRRAQREVDEHTKGQSFRLDTPDGPLFLDRPLWRFAGCSGLELSDDVNRPHKRRPTWDGASSASEAA